MLSNNISISINGQVVNGGSPPSGNWILATAFWADNGVYDDTAVWID